MVLIVLPPPQAHFSDVKHEKMFSLNQSMLTSNSSLNLYEKRSFSLTKFWPETSTQTHTTHKSLTILFVYFWARFYIFVLKLNNYLSVRSIIKTNGKRTEVLKILIFTLIIFIES